MSTSGMQPPGPGLHAALIAGGASRRMGSDKAGLLIAGETLLARTARLVHDRGLPLHVIGRARPADWNGPACAWVPDQLPGAGPLGGIATALAATAPHAVLVLPCDLPRLTPAALAWLIDRWLANGSTHGTAALRDGRLEPLFAIYAHALAPLLATALANGERSCWRALATAVLDRVEVPAEHRTALHDCDTPAEWDAARGPTA